MKPELRKTGISVVGDMPWGTHFCHFYETKQDLLDTLVPYFKAGLESNEFCVWVVSDSDLLSVEAAKAALAQAVPDLDRHLSAGNIEILDGLGWYLEENVFNLERVTSAWEAKLERALALGFDGMRVSGDTLWLADKNWKDFCAYEKQLDDSIADRHMNLLCTYPLQKAGAAEVLDVVQVHQFAIARRQGEWEVIESPELIQAKAEIKKLNEELEQQVIERSNELRMANEELRKEIAERKQAEDALRRSEDHLRLVIDTIPTMAWSLRPDAALDFVNQRWLDYTGLSFEEAIENETRTVHPEDLSRVTKKWLVVKDTSEPYEDEMRLQRADGEYRWFLVRIAPLLDEQGNLLKRYGVAIDIEERKHAEDDLRRQKEILQQIFDHIPVMISFVDADGCIKLVNHEWERTLGWSLEEIRQQNLDIFAECYPDPQDRQQVLKFVADAKGKWAEFKTRVRDGRVIDTIFVRVQLSDGTRIGIGQDITEHKHAEALLHAREQEFRAIVENAPDQIIRYDREFRRTYVNPAVLEAYGLPAESLIGKPVGSVIQDAALDVKVGELARLRQLIAAVFDTGKLYEYEMSWPAPAGRRYYSVRLFPELDLKGSVVHVLGISRDITERRSTEEELKKEKEILEKIFDNIPVMIGFVGDDGIKLVNPEWERTIGWTLKELQEQDVDIFAEAYPDPAYRQQVLDFVTASTGEWVDLKIRVRTGQVIDAACAVVHLSDGTRVAIAQDITERKSAEERIRATSEQLRALSAKLQSAKEEEDIRIAREIHDEMGSTLTSLRWDLERFDIVISEAEEWSQLRELRPKIAEMLRLTDTTISTMRRIASELRPSILDDLGLPETLEWQAQQFQARTGIVCRCDCSLENFEFDPDKSTAIFRIFQEALTNILSHAEAKTVDVVARSNDGEFVLSISDNGKGITEDEKSSRLSLGILGMRERAHLIGGKLEISGTNGRGTVLTVRIPNLR